MIEQNIDIQTSDGAMNSFVACPDEGGPFPVVLFYMDAPGKREELHDMARRLASSGYFVVLPNLYYRRSPDYVLGERTEVNLAEMFGHMYSLNRSTTKVDTQALLKFVTTQPHANSKKVGAVGYCMSGPIVFWAAVDFAAQIQCIASIHGANMVTDSIDSPHLMPAQIKCETYIACAQVDKWAPPADVEKLDQAFSAAKVNYRIEWYPNAQHGFVFPQRQGAYDKASAERHWVRLLALFSRHLS